MTDVLQSQSDGEDPTQRSAANLQASSNEAAPDGISNPKPESERVDVSENPAEGEVIDGQSLAQEIANYIGHYVVMNLEQLAACTLWVLHTWAFKAAVSTPYLFIVSPQKQSGKTRMQETLEMLVQNPVRTSGVTEAVIFRVIDAEHPTLMLDEADAIFAGTSERTEPIRGAIDSGNREGGVILRCVPPDFHVKPFSTFCPKCIAGIDKGEYPETILDRSIVLRVSRKKPHETVSRFRYRDAEERARPLQESAASWAKQNIDALRSARPEEPEGLSDRAMDAWEPLFAIADLLGGEWPEQARHVALKLYAAEQAQEDTIQLMLLRAIRALFAGNHNTRWPSVDLVDKLNNEVDGEDAPWLEQGGLTAHSLARLLRPFEISPISIRINQTTMKGYKSESFADAFERYLPGEDEGVSV